MRIGVVGCGTAGQAAAIHLARAGHHVTVFERTPQLGPVGAGILLQPTGLRVLNELGVGDQIARLSSPVHRLSGLNLRGRTVLDVRYGDREPGLFGLGVNRGSLFSTLLDRMNQLRIEIRTGVDVRSYAQPRHGVVEIFDGARRSLGHFELIIIGDGARSSLRAQSGLVRRATRYPWGAMWFVATDPDEEFAGVLQQYYHGTKGMVGFLPSGRSAVDSPSTVSVFLSVRIDEAGVIRQRGLGEFASRVRALTDRAETVLSQISDIAQVITASYHDVVLSRVFDGRVIFLGDAAHAMSPQLGQGANLALMDASELAKQLAEVSDVDVAIDRYDRARRANVRYYQWASRWLTPVFQSGLTPVGVVRDALMGPMSRAPIFRSLMLDSLVGIKTGVMPWSVMR